MADTLFEKFTRCAKVCGQGNKGKKKKKSHAQPTLMKIENLSRPPPPLPPLYLAYRNQAPQAIAKNANMSSFIGMSWGVPTPPAAPPTPTHPTFS